MRKNNKSNKTEKYDEYRKSLKKYDETWKEYKKNLEGIPSYLIIQKASDLILEYAQEKRPIEISWFDKEDDFIELWEKIEQMSLDMDKIATIDKALKTVKDFEI